MILKKQNVFLQITRYWLNNEVDDITHFMWWHDFVSLCHGCILLTFFVFFSSRKLKCLLKSNWNYKLLYKQIWEHFWKAFSYVRAGKKFEDDEEKSNGMAHDNDEGDMAPVKYYFYFIPKNTLLISHKKNSKNSDICIMWHSDSLTVIKAQNFLW